MAGLVPAIPLGCAQCVPKRDARDKPAHDDVGWLSDSDYEHPVVDPQVSHFMQVPLRTRVKLPHSPQASPS